MLTDYQKVDKDLTLLRVSFSLPFCIFFSCEINQFIFIFLLTEASAAEVTETLQCEMSRSHGPRVSEGC